MGGFVRSPICATTQDELERVLLKDGHANGVPVTITGSGEPLLEMPRVLSAARAARAADCGEISIVTNGTFLDDRVATSLRDVGVDIVSISMASLDHQTNCAIMGRTANTWNFETAASAVLSAGLTLRTSFVITKHMERSSVTFADFTKWCKGHGVTQLTLRQPHVNIGTRCARWCDENAVSPEYMDKMVAVMGTGNVKMIHGISCLLVPSPCVAAGLLYVEFQRPGDVL